MPVTHYVWDEVTDTIMAEYDGDGNLICSYTTEPELHGNVISQHRNGETSYFHHDGIGNTVAVTNDDGDVTDTFDYDAFGNVTARTGTTEVPFQFGGQKGYYTDFEVPYISVRRRNYEPKIARWLSHDPIGILSSDSTNLYQFVQNNPVNFIDPSGLIIEEILEKAESRRGKGRWEDSAQHCFAACLAGALFGQLGGDLAAVLGDIGELVHGSDDSIRDVVAQHIGSVCGSGYHEAKRRAGLAGWLCGLLYTPEWHCDNCCDTG